MPNSELAHSTEKQTEADLLLRKLGGHSGATPGGYGVGETQKAASPITASTSLLQEFSPTLLPNTFVIPLVYFQAAHQ